MILFAAPFKSNIKYKLNSKIIPVIVQRASLPVHVPLSHVLIKYPDVNSYPYSQVYSAIDPWVVFGTLSDPWDMVGRLPQSVRKYDDKSNITMIFADLLVCQNQNYFPFSKTGNKISYCREITSLHLFFHWKCHFIHKRKQYT